MRWKAVTPNFLVSQDWNITIEKKEDGKHFIVAVNIGDKLKERLFGTEEEADNFIQYLTDGIL